MIAVAFGLSCPLTGVMRALGRRLGHVDVPGGHKRHARPIPLLGGVAIFQAILLPILAGLAVGWITPDSFWQTAAEHPATLLSAIAPHISGVHAMTPMLLGLLGSLLLLHIMGLIDDRRPLSPFLKLIVQAGCAAILVVGFQVRLLEFLGPILSITLTLLWFLTITNAINFLDNMDGLSSGVALIAAAIFLAIALISGQFFIALLLSLLIGGLLGFLVFNFPPATIFMGDGGSLVVGFLLAFCAVRVTYYAPQATEAAGAMEQMLRQAHGLPAPATAGQWAMLTPLVVLAIPLYDIFSVTLLRTLQGKSPFRPDTQHFSHRLVRKGLSRRAAVIVIWACTLATGLGGILLGQVHQLWQAWLIAGQTAAILLLLALLERSAPSREESA